MKRRRMECLFVKLIKYNIGVIGGKREVISWVVKIIDNDELISYLFGEIFDIDILISCGFVWIIGYEK